MSHFSLFDLDRSLAIMEISLGLVRRTHLRNGIQLSADELASLDIIQLNSMNIATIDNLEVFDQIRELHFPYQSKPRHPRFVAAVVVHH